MSDSTLTLVKTHEFKRGIKDEQIDEQNKVLFGEQDSILLVFCKN